MVYDFYIGHLGYLIPEGKQTIYLHIPELPARDAEGRPKYPEQADWINQVLTGQHINAKNIWWSHWRFDTTHDAIDFEQYLQTLGAMTARTNSYW